MTQSIRAHALIQSVYAERIEMTAYPHVARLLQRECRDWQDKFFRLLAHAYGGRGEKMKRKKFEYPGI